VVDRAEREESIQEIINRLRPLLAGVHSAKLSVSATARAGGGMSAIAIELTGKDMDELRRFASEVRAQVEQVPGVSDVDLSWRSGRPELKVVPLPRAGGRYHLSLADIAPTIRAYIEGRTVTQLRERGEDYDIRIRLDRAALRWAEDVGRLFIKSPVTGEMVPIRQVAQLRYESGPTVITRKNRRRLITVTGNLTGERPLGEVQRDIEERIRNNLTVPRGVDINFGGQSEMMRRNFRELFKAMATAAALTFLSVAGIIESFVYGTIILMAVPVCLVGVVLAMLMGNVTVSLLSLMAIIMLVGMVVNNAIIVLDYATRREQGHLPPAERVREACGVRFRLMMMANLTTIAAMVPLALGLGFAGEIFRPIAVVEIGGVAAAATLSLVVIPVLFTSVQNWREKRTARTQAAPGQGASA